ncbi:helicase-related protein [Phycicoccus sp. DTK01]|uniref:helicase-related protein n=1 Tax=Phycicoccus sp. DTK01 TaxID=2785745 RepID=UPI001A8D4F0E|nr:helicase-related protein [Phycicoccus sp. DTK01]GIL33994.1 DNA helicase [Phycicoccus sp. DTK01]
MNDLHHAYETRDRILDRLGEDLLGGDGDRRLTEAPLTRFVMGVLYPDVEADVRAPVQLSLEDEVENDVEAEAGNGAPDDVVDPAVSMSRIRYPRSMGMTLSLADTPGAGIEVTVRATRYENDGDEEWRAVDVLPDPLHVSVSPAGYTTQTVTDGLDLVVITRAALKGAVAVTLTLVNTQSASPGDKDAFAWFRPVITARAVATRLVERPPAALAGVDEAEIQSQNLLFRDVRSYAVGHGCSVTWAGNEPDEVSTTYLPRHELLLSDAAGGQGLDLSMTKLAADSTFVVLDELVAGYRRWIDGLPSTAQQPLDDREEETLRRHMADASVTADRMEAGVRLLQNDEQVRRAFQMTNRAMAQQRSRQEHHRAGELGNPPSIEGAHWRPFQIAFILLNLPGLADEDHPDREVADLLWFPTGGGKTEAYLGIIGVAILLRRLRDAKAAGVSVLMRYTLRLLTLQQYQRATGLICALEIERQKHLPDAAPISIGLWVGGASTPNKIDDARRALDKARKPGARDLDGDESDPVQLRRCPWCGTAMNHENYEIVERSWMRVACRRDDCAFRNGLPVHIVDDDVYANRPSLVIGTVDKFAMMPWKREVGALLGNGNSVADPTYHDLPPDLVVQDELHLISGPLGTMVGLYETAVDAIAGRTARPKVVASTATIRRATDQVRAVFAREAAQFPPPGLTHRHSFFAEESSRDLKASREYAGVMAPGASQTTLMVRVYASLLQSAAMVAETDGSADLYWTLVGYFNSLRILGGAFIQVMDDVPDQIKVVARRRGEEPRNPRAIREMTSRKRSSEIPKELEILELPRGADAADVVLATNMISVGVDVDRLGLMVVMGQPQTSSEYIQATSRVGRRNPGLVVTIYNSGRSRDLSHYENFAAYHRTLYRHVEATGATPFAPRARDRALHAVLVSMARQRIAAAAPSEAAKNVEDWENELRELAEVVVARSESTRPEGHLPTDDESSERIRQELDDLVEHWLDGRVQRYEGWFGKHRGALLVEASRVLSRRDEDPPVAFPPAEPAWPTLTSMRDVDAESSVFLVRRRRNRRER